MILWVTHSAARSANMFMARTPLTNSVELDSKTRSKIELLACYLALIPKELDSKINASLNFSLDPSWLEDIGEEACVNRQIEAAFFECGPGNDKGVSQIKERGPVLEALPAVLQVWIDKYHKSLPFSRAAACIQRRACVQSAASREDRAFGTYKTNRLSSSPILNQEGTVRPSGSVQRQEHQFQED